MRETEQQLNITSQKRPVKNKHKSLFKRLVTLAFILCCVILSFNLITESVIKNTSPVKLVSAKILGVLHKARLSYNYKYVPLNDDEYFCNRKERYQNMPEIESALELIDNLRYKHSNKTLEPPSTVSVINCVKVEYVNLSVTGGRAMVTTSKDSFKKNDYTVYVDEKFKELSTPLLALTLQHELTHVWQNVAELYFADRNVIPTNKCLSYEVDAFSDEIFLYERFPDGMSITLESEATENKDNSDYEKVRVFMDLLKQVKENCSSGYGEGVVDGVLTKGAINYLTCRNKIIDDYAFKRISESSTYHEMCEDND